MKAHTKFYFPLDEFKDNRKIEFVAVRLQRDLFIQLKQKAQEERTDLSNMIRALCKSGLQNG